MLKTRFLTLGVYLYPALPGGDLQVLAPRSFLTWYTLLTRNRPLKEFQGIQRIQPSACSNIR